MNIGEVIRKYRKQKNMTQEEMANRLGVTAPAVNKWENGNSYPDILLLSPIARLLEISLDTLLSFQNRLTEEEIQAMVYEADRVFKEKTYQEGFLWVKKKLEEYPNCEQLIWQMAVILEVRSLFRNQEIPDSEKYEEYIYRCYTRILNSKEEEIRTHAADSLFGFYVRKEEYEKAEEILSYFSNQNPEKKRRQGLIYSKTHRTEEAYKTYEELLFSEYQMVNVIFHSLYLLAMEEDKADRALKYVEKQTELADTFDMGEYHKTSCWLDLLTAQKDTEAVIETMERMLSSVDTVYDFCKSPLYEHMKWKEVRKEFLEDLKQNLRKCFRDDETYGFLRGNKRWESL